MNFAIRLYGALARAFPHEFQMAYGADVIQLAEDIGEQIAKENGFLGALPPDRGFAAAGFLSLAPGIGISAVSVSEAVNMLLGDAPGIRDADRVATVNDVSIPSIGRYREQHGLFAGAAAFQIAAPYNVSLGRKVDEYKDYRRATWRAIPGVF
jgi:hypothetical protein